jgi:hypothetical protein
MKLREIMQQAIDKVSNMDFSGEKTMVYRRVLSALCVELELSLPGYKVRENDNYDNTSAKSLLITDPSQTELLLGIYIKLKIDNRGYYNTTYTLKELHIDNELNSKMLDKTLKEVIEEIRMKDIGELKIQANRLDDDKKDILMFLKELEKQLYKNEPITFSSLNLQWKIDKYNKDLEAINKLNEITNNITNI